MLTVRGAVVFCALIAAVVGAPGRSDTPFSIRSGTRPSFVDTVGNSLPNDTVYSPMTVSTYPLALSIVDVSLGTATSLENCRLKATSKGGQIFEYSSSNGRCNVASIQFPLCGSGTGKVNIYVLPGLISTGTSNDGTTVEPLKKGVLLYSVLKNPSAEYGSFRVDNPIILDYPEYFNADAATSLQTVFKAEDSKSVQIDSDIVVSHACRSNSSCGTPFIYPIPVSKPRIIYFNESCNGLVQVREDVYVLSHSGFGCTLFPNEGYGRYCPVNYRGYGAYAGPLKFTYYLFNFVGDDQCNGFQLSIRAYNIDQTSNVTNLCAPPAVIREVISPFQRGRFDFNGKAKTNRPQIGFIIKISRA